VFYPLSIYPWSSAGYICLVVVGPFVASVLDYCYYIGSLFGLVIGIFLYRPWGEFCPFSGIALLAALDLVLVEEWNYSHLFC
jgi:cytosine/uracil/thiamine/allantoin permease